MLRKSSSKAGSRGGDEPSTPEEEQVKIEQFRAALGPLTGKAEQYANDACLKRYLRARNWNLKKAEKMMRDSLAWRESYKPEEIRWSDIAGETETGKTYRASFNDKQGHTVLVMHPARQNTNAQAGQIKQLVYSLENAILNLPEGQEQMIWLIDFKGWGLKQSTPISTARETANILQNHYPERLYVAILYNPPRVFEAFWTIVKPFLDPKTFRKVKFVYSKNAESMKILSELFDEDTLKGTFDNPNDYNHEQYSKLMEEDDMKSSLYWKGGETITESKGVIDTPDVDSLKIEEPVENGHTEAPVVPPVVAAS